MGPESLSENSWDNKEKFLKEMLEQSLNTGIYISNADEYSRWVKLLKTNNIADLSNANFTEISTDWLPFAIKKVNKSDSFIIVMSTVYVNKYIKTWFPKVWIINNWWNFKKETSFMERYTDKDNKWIKSDTLVKLEDLSKEIEKNPTKVSSRPAVEYSKEAPRWVKRSLTSSTSTKVETRKGKEADIPTMDTLYTIQKWDTLWNIAKTFFPHENNRELANIVNRIAKYNEKIQNRKGANEEIPPPDWIKWDKIYVGKVLHIPPQLKVLWKIINRYE